MPKEYVSLILPIEQLGDLKTINIEEAIGHLKVHKKNYDHFALHLKPIFVRKIDLKERRKKMWLKKIGKSHPC